VSLKRYSTRRDKTEPEILRAISKAGADYILLDPIDVLVLYRGRIFLLECKSTRGKKATMCPKTENQEILVKRGWPLLFVSSAEQALAAIGAYQDQQGEKR
jgi:hypothetical protein